MSSSVFLFLKELAWLIAWKLKIFDFIYLIFLNSFFPPRKRVKIQFIFKKILLLLSLSFSFSNFHPPFFFCTFVNSLKSFKELNSTIIKMRVHCITIVFVYLQLLERISFCWFYSYCWRKKKTFFLIILLGFLKYMLLLFVIHWE